MAFVLVGNSPYGYPLYRDTATGDCYQLEDGDLVYYGQCPNNTVQNSPQLPSITTPNASTGGVLIQSGGSWYNDLLNTLLGLSAIGAGATHIPSTNQGVSNQNSYLQALQQQQQNQGVPRGSLNTSNVGSTVGNDLQKFVTQNATYLIIGVGIYMLYKSGRK